MLSQTVKKGGFGIGPNLRSALLRGQPSSLIIAFVVRSLGDTRAIWNI